MREVTFINMGFYFLSLVFILFFNKTVLSLVEYLKNLPSVRARFDENTGVGLKRHVKECPLWFVKFTLE